MDHWMVPSHRIGSLLLAHNSKTTTTTTTMTIPSPDQTWAHSTCSVASLTRALEDDSITAIEADVVLGTCVGPSCAGVVGPADGGAGPVPVMAHPPQRATTDATPSM